MQNNTSDGGEPQTPRMEGEYVDHYTMKAMMFTCKILIVYTKTAIIIWTGSVQSIHLAYSSGSHSVCGAQRVNNKILKLINISILLNKFLVINSRTVKKLIIQQEENI